MAKAEKYPVIFITRPRIKINFDCAFCSAKYKTISVSIVHRCSECKKENVIKKDDYSMDAISYYLMLAHAKLDYSNGIILRATDSYKLLLESLANHLTRLGMREKKNHRVPDVNKRTQKEIIVNEIVLEKLGAIR